MRLPGFFRLTWTLQLLVGVALFSVSFLIEGRILTAFFAVPLIAWTLAIALEIGKAAAIVFHRHLSQSLPDAYPVTVRLTSGVFRFGLIALSLICSLLYLGVQLDRPHVEALRRAGLDAIETRLGEDLERLDAEQHRRGDAQRMRQAEELSAARAEHRRRIQDLEARLSAEMDNVVGGVFKGSRYKDFLDTLDRLMDELRAILSENVGAPGIDERRGPAG